VVWLTGLPSSGKTTVSELVAADLRERGVAVELLDGDVVRQNLCKGLGFSKEDRDTNVLRIGFVARLLARHGVVVLVAAVSPYRAARAEIRREALGEGSFFTEVYVSCPLEVAERRDRKGLYRLARAGRIEGFTGVSDPYEAPLAPDVLLETDRQSAEESARAVLAFLYETRSIPRDLPR
jgi:adenylyl-sulfate kinase